MAEPKSWPWYEKVRAEIGRRGWSVSELWRRMLAAGFEVRGQEEDASLLRRWLKGKHRPREGVIASSAAALGWTTDYLNDPEQAYPPRFDKQWAEGVLKRLNPDALKVVGLLSDPRAAAYLANAADQYLKLMGKSPGR
jgi:hypothetical protein